MYNIEQLLKELPNPEIQHKTNVEGWRKDPTQKAAVQKLIVSDMAVGFQQLKNIRTHIDNPIDLTIDEFVKERYGIESFNHYLWSLGVDPSRTTIQSLISTPGLTPAEQWLVPEVFREAIRLGLTRTPIYPKLVAGTSTIKGNSVVMPFINRSNGIPVKIGEGESIPKGSMSFNSKRTVIQKRGIGFEITDEVKQNCPLNLLSIYTDDVATNLGLQLDGDAIKVLIEGESGQNNAAPVIGVDNTTNGLEYKDLLRAWLRMGRLGLLADILISGEEMGLNIELLDQFSKRYTGTTDKQRVSNILTPDKINHFVHSGVPANKSLVVAPLRAIWQFISVPLMAEPRRNPEKQIDEIFISISTGFGKILTDSALVIDQSLLFSSNGFPTEMDPTNAEKPLA